MRLLLFALSLLAPVWGQGFHVGIDAGVPLTSYFETGATGGLHGHSSYSSGTRRYVLGVSGEWELNRSLGFEADVLYRRMGYSGQINFFDSANGDFNNSAVDVNGNSWDFPVLAKYRFGRGVRQFVEGGGVFRYIGPVHETGEITSGSLVTGASATARIDTGNPSDLAKRFYTGLAFGAGVEFGAGRLRLVPQFRYTRWTSNISGAGGVLRFTPNQADFILGLVF